MTPPLRRSRLLFVGLASLAAFSTLLLAAGSASAQSSVLANRFDPSEKGSDWWENESLDYRGSFRPAFGIIADYSKDPIVLRQSDGSSNGSLISDQLYLHLGGSIVLWERLRVGLELPVELAETGTTTVLPGESLASPSGAAFGDLRAGADFRVWGQYEDPFRIAVGAQVYFPTGSADHYTTEGDVRVMPRIMVAGDIDAFTYALRLGYEVNPGPATILGHQVGDEVSMGAAIGLRFLNRDLIVGPEISSYTLVTNAFQSVTTPTEILMGAHYRIDDIKIGAGIGTSFDPGDSIGSPTFRMLVGLEWHPDIAPPPAPLDRDEDGIPDEFDACPDKPGPYSDEPHLNGCPPDRDHDGIPDDVDACPDVPGVKTDDPKTNGCPAPPADRDHDGIPDVVDACPDIPGVPNADPKLNGCPPPPPPDPDRDKDGIPNDLDACPDAAGPADPDPKKNGCPLARVENGQIKISEQVKFATASAQILKDSDKVLGAVLEILNAHPEIAKLRIQGYTDNKGAAAYNKTLSDKRAAPVKAWLVLHKVDASRLDSHGYGMENPIDDNATEAGRTNNRRVEFHIGEKDEAPAGGAATPPATPPAASKPAGKP
jgi:OmpA-OmpF porin, OOP family